MVFDHKPRKLIMITANCSKSAKDYCQNNKNSVYYNRPFQTHDEDIIFTNFKNSLENPYGMDFNQRLKNIGKFIKKVQSQIKSCSTPASNLKIGKFVLIPNFYLSSKNPEEDNIKL